MIAGVAGFGLVTDRDPVIGFLDPILGFRIGEDGSCGPWFG
jgi:hypothetical protein